MSPQIGIVVCRQASDYRKPGYVLGYSCKICGKELQVGPVGVAALKNNASLVALCNDCGFAMEKRLRDAGAGIDMVFSPEATARLEELVSAVKAAKK